MRHSLSLGVVVVILALMSCSVDENAAENARDTLEADRDKVYLRLPDRGYRLERAPRYLM